MLKKFGNNIDKKNKEIVIAKGKKNYLASEYFGDERCCKKVY